MVHLKHLLRERNLPTTGSKAELIKRLSMADPAGTWKISATTEKEATMEREGASDVASSDTIINVGNSTDSGVVVSPSETERALRREMELLRREQELRERELQLIRRENDALRRTPILQTTPRNRE